MNDTFCTSRIPLRCILASLRPDPRDVKHTDISPQHVFNLLLLETTFDDETPAAVDGAAGSQFGKQVGCNVLVGPLHPLANLGNVGKDGLLVTFAQALRWWDLVTPRAAASVIRVLLGQQGEEA